MTDRVSAKQRSRNMSAIKGKNTTIEQFICHELFKRGYRYRKNVNYVYGHPDIFLRKYNTAFFINGCFWHRHEGCKYAYMPKTRVEFWNKKFDNNKRRDQNVSEALIQQGIKKAVVWECTVHRMMRDSAYCDSMMTDITAFLLSEELCKEW